MTAKISDKKREVTKRELFSGNSARYCLRSIYYNPQHMNHYQIQLPLGHYDHDTTENVYEMSRLTHLHVIIELWYSALCDLLFVSHEDLTCGKQMNKRMA